MQKKYIKDRNGKFRGSLPENNIKLPSSLPSLPKLPAPNKDENMNNSFPSSSIHPAAKAWERVQELDRLGKKVREAKSVERSFRLFSPERGAAKSTRVELENLEQLLRKELTNKCWRCYGTGKPFNGQGDTMEIFAECPACENKPLPQRPPSW